MRKFYFFLSAFILLPIFLFAQENVIPIKIVEFPLPESAYSYQFQEYRSFKEMDRPFMGDGFSCKFVPYISDNAADYTIDEADILVFKKVINVEKTESIGTVFFTVYFQYTIYQNGEAPKEYTFSVVGNGAYSGAALEKCFRNGAIHVTDIASSISAHPADFLISTIVAGEYILSCGKKDNIGKGDEFHVYSKRNGQDIGKLYAVNVKEDITIAQPIYLKDQVLAGDSVDPVRLLGFGANLYCDWIFGDNLGCLGLYMEYFRFFRAFRFLVGTEYIAGLDDNCWNLYCGFKTMWHLGYVDLSSLIYIGRGYADGSFRYTGGSIKVIAEFAPKDWMKVGVETGFTQWLADHDNDYPNFGGFLLGAGITLRF